MKHSESYKFSQVPVATIPRSVFNRSHQYKTTFDAGKLIPFFCDEVLPGDTFNCKVSIFARLFTPVAPIMDNLYLDVHFFFVPCRLVWANWQRFCGEQTNPGDSISYVVPTCTAVPTLESLFDYFGLPVMGASLTVNALPFRCYNRIWNEWYRDENLQNSVSMVTGDGPDAPGAYVLLPRGKRHDYFTSSLPWPQKGTGVQLPLGTSAPVKGIGHANAPFPGAGTPFSAVKETGGTTRNYAFGQALSAANWLGEVDSASTSAFPLVYADLSAATGPTINSLRQAFQIQKLMERDARGGTRYVELLKSHFGVTSPDFRLQRPEYLGGGTVPVVIQPVAQTSNSAPTTTPQGTLAAFGTAARTNLGFTKSFVEHGYIIGIVSGRADLTYYQGVSKLWRRSTRYDFFWPALAHIGEQAVLQGEIFSDGSSNDTSIVFGYQERWAEYKYFASMITGLFRPGVSGSLAFWHAAQSFTVAPVLSAAFIQDPAFVDATSPMNRLKALTTAPDYLLDSYFQVQCARPMPLYSVPGLTDHF